MNIILFNLPTLSHFLIGFYFAFFGIWNIYHWSPLLEIMAQKGLPHPYLVLPWGIGWQIIAGCMIIFGMYIKIAALSLIPFTILAVCFFHPFWNFKGEARKSNFSIFITNMTVVLGALCALITPVTQITDLLS